MTQKQTSAVRVPTTWETIENVQTIYANQLVITHSGAEFYLIFGEVQLPILLDPKVDKIPKTVKVKPVARIAITPELMVQFASVISENVGKYLEKISQMDSEDDLDIDTDEES